MKKIIVSFAAFLLCLLNLEAQTSVENKAISKKYSISSSAVNAYVIAANFDITIAETGNYLILVEADAIVPSASANNCQFNTYWNAGHVFIFNRTTGNELGVAVGEYKWIIVPGQNNCSGAHTVPRSPTRSYIRYLQAGHKLAVKAMSEKVGTMALAPWSYSGTIQLIRLN